mgnify:CR=1 FL=1
MRPENTGLGAIFRAVEEQAAEPLAAKPVEHGDDLLGSQPLGNRNAAEHRRLAFVLVGEQPPTVALPELRK